MGKLKDLQIVLDRNVFCQGDVIKGNIVLDVEPDGAKDVRTIRLRFEGQAELLVPKNQFKEVYFNTVVDVYGTGQEQAHYRKLQILPGSNTIPFEFPLPNLKPLPFSFESKVGFVRYQAQATVSVKQLLLTKDFKTQKHFSLIGPACDLNTVPDAGAEVMERTMKRTLWIGPVQNLTTVGLPRRGYVPGESITVTGHVENRSGQPLRHFTAKLIQTTNVKFMEKKNSDDRKNATLSEASAKVTCRRAQTTDFTVGPLLIPPVPPSGLSGCSLLSIEYFVQITESNLDKIQFPVVIGTVPLRSDPPEPGVPRSPDFTAELAARLEQRATAAPSFGGFPLDHPPSYAEAVGVSNDAANGPVAEDTFSSEDHFAPRYPYFNPNSKNKGE